ncbi:SIR2 family NAD-dependent protein deacylase [Variovorax sp. CCNWLW235]|uniref:SIR2 family NAD-dependent protein deacylase n=1 Tax=Variovorax sp. CCNWLW235 TaxID=3127463 RepID=UPI003077DB10
MSSTAPSRRTAKRSKPRSKPRAAPPRTAVQKPDDEKLAQLREAHRRGKVVLFVGAGISMGLGLPPWSALIEHMARELGIDARSFGDKGGYLTLAEYFRLRHGSIGPLRSWMDREWHRGDVRVESSRIHELLAKGRFPIIYTTNYDRWLETAFEHHKVKYTKIVSVADLAKLHPGVTQIIKFHGDLEDDASIVLDESSYFARLDFESPLDIKLRADVLGRSVVFIGYSLADVNIRYLFYKLSRLWKQSVPDVAQPVSYLFSPSANEVQQAVLAQWGIEMIPLARDDPSKALIEFLEAVVG